MDVYWDDTSKPVGSRRNSPLATGEEKRHRRAYNTSRDEADRFRRQNSAFHSSRSPTRPSLDSNRSQASPSRDRRRSEMSRDTKREQQQGRGMYIVSHRDGSHQHRDSSRRPWKGKDSVAEFTKDDDTDGRSELDEEEEESEEDFGGGEGEDEDERDENYAEEAEQQLRTLDRLLKQLSAAIEDVHEKKKRGADALRNHQLTIQKLQQEIDTAISALDLELRCIASSIPSVYRSTLVAQKHQKEQQLASLMRLYEENLLSVNRQDLLAYRAAVEEEQNNSLGLDGEDGGGISSERTRQTLVQMGDDIQDKTQASLNRTKQLVGETEEIGAQVLARMNEQTEKLHKANDDLDDVQYNINRAKKTALVIAKNAAGDRFTQCLCLFIVLFLIIAVVLVCVPR